MGERERGRVLEHLAWCRFRNLAASTITQRRYALARLERYVGEAPAELEVEPIRDYLTSLETAGHRATELSHLRQFYRWLQAEGHRGDEPTARIPRPRQPKRLPRPISEDDLTMAYELAGGRIRAWILLGAWAGLRCCEMAGLRREHLAGGLVLIERAKGGDPQTVPCSPWLAAELERCGLPVSGWLFPNHDGRGPLPAYRVSQLGSQYLHSLGIDATMHQLRHRFGTQAHLASGGDVRHTQELLRHATITSTQVYTYVDPGQKAEIVAALPTPGSHDRAGHLELVDREAATRGGSEAGTVEHHEAAPGVAPSRIRRAG